VVGCGGVRLEVRHVVGGHARIKVIGGRLPRPAVQVPTSSTRRSNSAAVPSTQSFRDGELRSMAGTPYTMGCLGVLRGMKQSNFTHSRSRNGPGGN
jgi:hypothetical protein